MADRKFTFLEIHLDGDTQFGPKFLDGIGGADEPAGDSEEAVFDRGSEQGASSLPKVLGVVVVLAIFVVAGVAIRRYRNDESESEPLERTDVTIE